MSDMFRVVQFSGGKDSTALVLWAREQFGVAGFTAVFCDTKWEHPLTYAYIEEIDRTVLGGKLVTVTSEKYPDGMRDVVREKQLLPSHRIRFCTSELKVFPFAAWMNAQEYDEATVYQGIRANESSSRSKMAPRVWEELYGAWIERPLFDWTAEQCFELMARHGVEPNPLYRLGSSRVGCFPCIMTGHSELRRVGAALPEVWDRIAEIESCVSLAGRHWFARNYIPERFHTGRYSKPMEREAVVSFPTIDDVRRYVTEADEQQARLFDRCGPSGCMSVYNLCE